MCDDMDDLENDYKHKLREQAEEINRLKIKCGEISNTDGLLNSFRKGW